MRYNIPIVFVFLNNELKLELSPDKTKITSLTDDRAKFLGVYFGVSFTKGEGSPTKVVVKYNDKAKRYIKHKINQTSPQIRSYRTQDPTSSHSHCQRQLSRQNLSDNHRHRTAKISKKL